MHHFTSAESIMQWSRRLKTEINMSGKRVCDQQSQRQNSECLQTIGITGCGRWCSNAFITRTRWGDRWQRLTVSKRVSSRRFSLTALWNIQQRWCWKVTKSDLWKDWIYITPCFIYQLTQTNKKIHKFNVYRMVIIYEYFLLPITNHVWLYSIVVRAVDLRSTGPWFAFSFTTQWSMALGKPLIHVSLYHQAVRWEVISHTILHTGPTSIHGFSTLADLWTKAMELETSTTQRVTGLRRTVPTL